MASPIVTTASGLAIPRIGLGTWTLLGADAQRMVEAALEVGYRHIDTARAYNNEPAVGAGIRNSGVDRNAVFLTTKVWFTELAPADLLRSLEASVDDLGVGAVDLALVHWPSPAVPLAQSIEALNEAVRRGLARNIGVSNFPSALYAEACDLSEAPIQCNQVEYHPFLDQSRLLEATQARGAALTAYSPLSRGGDLLELPEVTGPAARLGCTPAQVVLAWHMSHPNVVAIPRTSKPERLAENLGVFDLELTADEIDAISRLRSRNARICDFEFSPRWDV